ncbi:MAG: HAMP domain-containing sensor histidine kinase, partial [Kovacikia sp.]
QFCPLSTQSWRGQIALSAFPIKNNGDVIGDIWLLSFANHILDNLEMRLVQQVTNQSAIGIRQARLYEAAQAQVRELEQLNQLKDDFLSTVSHELRTPLTNMRMAIQLLQQFAQHNQELGQKMAELSANFNKSNAYLQILHSECDREISLINNLLDLQRLEVGQQPFNPTHLDLQAWLTQEIESFALQANARQQMFQAHLAAFLPKVTIEPIYLQRILTELINNACKYSPAGATINLTAQLAESSPSTVWLTVTNTGATIPERELEHIFDKFYRIPGGDRWKQGGTGLGLALVKRLAEQFGGSVWATSQADQTCFTIALPVSLEAAEDSSTEMGD